MKNQKIVTGKFKWVYTILFMCIILFAVSLMSLTQFVGLNSEVITLSNWIKEHKSIFIFWHILIIAAIYYCWGLKIDKAKVQHQISENDVKKAKRFRYWMIAFVVLIDVIIHWY